MFAMRYFRYINAYLCILVFSTTVLGESLLGFFNNNEVPATSLEKCQVSGVVGTSQFLRRAYQACEQHYAE